MAKAIAPLDAEEQKVIKIQHMLIPHGNGLKWSLEGDTLKIVKENQSSSSSLLSSQKFKNLNCMWFTVGWRPRDILGSF